VAAVEFDVAPIWESVHSRHSMRIEEPGLTVAAGGMSGCQRLWPGTTWSRIDLAWSTLNTTSGMVGTSSGSGEMDHGRGSRAWRGSVASRWVRPDRDGSDVTTAGASALQCCASRALRRPAGSERSAGAPKTRRPDRPQPGQVAGAPDSPMGRTRSKPPQAGQEYV
jgi:hypothetical protein